MFTGLIEQCGKVQELTPLSGGVSLLIDPCGWSHVPQRGASIAVNGCCLTVAARTDSAANSTTDLSFNVIHQTLRTTTLGDLVPGDRVHLEQAATPATLLGGHIVQGHIDGVATVREVLASGGEHRITFEPPADLMDAIIERGSVALDGVSLTVAAITDHLFTVALIPTTLALTTFGRLATGSRVNLETDYLARTVIHWLRRQGRLRDEMQITPTPPDLRQSPGQGRE